jgi:hypothetical protein
MRIAGYLLLCGGFLRLCYTEFSISQVKIKVLSDGLGEMPQRDQFTLREARNIVIHTSRIAGRQASEMSVLVPATMMLIGGIVVGLARQRVETKKAK